MRSIPISVAALLLGASLAFATPQVRVQSLDGVPRIELEGSYPQSRDASGRLTGPGTYFVTVRSPLGEARARLTRVR